MELEIHLKTWRMQRGKRYGHRIKRAFDNIWPVWCLGNEGGRGESLRKSTALCSSSPRVCVPTRPQCYMQRRRRRRRSRRPRCLAVSNSPPPTFFFFPSPPPRSAAEVVHRAIEEFIPPAFAFRVWWLSIETEKGEEGGEGLWAKKEGGDRSYTLAHLRVNYVHTEAPPRFIINRYRRLLYWRGRRRRWYDTAN